MLGNKEFRVNLDYLGSQVTQERQANLVLKGRKELRAMVVLRVHKEPQVLQDSLVLPETMDNKEVLDCKD